MRTLEKISDGIDGLNNWIGRSVSWLTIFMVLTTFLIVVLRYVFNLGWIWLQETVNYMHSIVFLVAAGYVLLKDGHVRVDIFYRGMSEKKKAFVNLLGSIFLLAPVCILIFVKAFPYVWDSWANLEGSAEAGGLEGVFLLKSLILVYASLFFLQGVSIVAKSFLLLKGKESG